MKWTGYIHRSNYQKTLREDKRRERIMELQLHPKVIEVIDRENLTPLQGLIIHYLTDPTVEYSSKQIASYCVKQLQQGSKRSVRRVKAEMPDIISDVELARSNEEAATTETIEVASHKSDEDNGIIDMGDGGWDVTEELDCVTACSKAPKKAMVSISAIARKKISLFMKWAGSEEWLAYLQGEFVDEKTVIVTDVALPSQNASATLVHNVSMDNYNQLGIVGVIHSHHDMGHGSSDNPGFSGHDNAFINANHNVSLLVSTKGIAGHVRVKTPCGAFMKVNATIKHMDEVELDEKKLQEEFRSNIQFGSSRQYGSSEDLSVNFYDKNRVPTRDNYHF